MAKRKVKVNFIKTDLLNNIIKFLLKNTKQRRRRTRRSTKKKPIVAPQDVVANIIQPGVVAPKIVHEPFIPNSTQDTTKIKPMPIEIKMVTDATTADEKKLIESAKNAGTDIVIFDPKGNYSGNYPRNEILNLITYQRDPVKIEEVIDVPVQRPATPPPIV